MAGLVAWLLSVSWMRWMDPFIDFGREVYLPWRVLEGEHLGRDFVHPYGPFSVYLNAGVFALFGVSIRNLVFANLGVFVLAFTGMFLVARRAFGFLPAAVALAFAVPIFGFPHYAGVNNYSFLAPYSHEATHGMAFLIALLLWLGRPTMFTTSSRMPHIFTGLICGALCLTKSEYVVVTVLLLSVWAVRSWCDPLVRPHLWRSTLAVAVGFALVFGITGCAMAIATTPANAARTIPNAIVAPFSFAAYSRSAHVLHFLGADRLEENLGNLFRWGGNALLVLAAAGLSAKAVNRAGEARWIRVVFALVAIVAAVWGTLRFSWIFCATTFPFLLGAAAVCLVRTTVLSSSVKTISIRRWNQLLFFVAAVGMLARMAFDPTISHYGFFQAVLAGTWLCAFLIAEYPRMFALSGAPRAALRLGIVIFLAGGAVALTRRSLEFYRAKQTPVGTAADEIRGYTQEIYPLVGLWERTRAFIAAQTPSDSALLVIPEGISLNYWTRRKHPLRITDVLPATLALNPRDVATDLALAPPDYIVIIPRQMAELGFERYGQDAASGRSILQWVEKNYRLLAREGDDPLNPKAVGVWVLKRIGK